MISPIKILITAVGSELSLSIIKACKLFSRPVEVVGCDMQEEVVGRFLCDNFFIIPPASNEDEYISTLNFKGTDLDFFYASDPNKPMIPSGLPSILYDSYTMVEGGIKIKCDKSSLNKFKKAIDFNQNFPFSYYALAVCDKESGGNNWEGYAKEAFDILKITTKIEGHNPEHDRAFKILNEYNN